jgi:HemY protein
LHDPAWTADGYVSDRWRPVSPVTGRLDAFKWQTPVASLPSDRGPAIDISPFEEAMLAAPAPRLGRESLAEPPRDASEATPTIAAQDNSPPAAASDLTAAPEPKLSEAPAEPSVESPAVGPAPLFRARTDLGKPGAAQIPTVIPILRPPDDPGIDEDAPNDEFSDQIAQPRAQAGGWRGFLSRFGG